MREWSSLLTPFPEAASASVVPVALVVAADATGTDFYKNPSVHKKIRI